MYFKVLLAALLILTVFALPHRAQTTSCIIDSSLPYVYLKFDHVGAREPVFPGEDRRGLWLRLVNNSRIPIEVGIFNPETNDPGIGVFDEVVKNQSVRGLMRSSGTEAIADAKLEKIGD